MQHNTRKTANGKATSFNIDDATLARLHHIQAFTAETLGELFSMSTLVRRAVETYSNQVDSLIHAHRLSLNKGSNIKETYMLKQASQGALLPFSLEDEPSPFVDGELLTFEELIAFHFGNLMNETQGNV